MTVVFVLMTVEPGKEAEVKKKVDAMSETQETHILYGEYDIIAKIEVEDLSRMDCFIKKLRGVKGLRDTMTMISHSG